MRIVSTQEFFLKYGRNPMLSQFIRKVISKSLTITDQFPFYQFLVKFLKSLFLFHYLNFFIKTISLMIINLVGFLGIWLRQVDKLWYRLIATSGFLLSRNVRWAVTSDFEEISEWVHQWKIFFNPDNSKQAQ